MKRRPLEPGEALALSLVVHAAFLILFTVHTIHSAAPAPPPPPPKPVHFQFVNQPETPPLQPPKEDAPLSDIDRSAKGGEATTTPPENQQPRMTGNTAQMVIPSQPAPQPITPRPKPTPKTPPKPREQPKVPRPGPSPKIEDRPPTLEEKREKIQNALSQLETGDLFKQKFDNPSGEFFGTPDADISFEAKGVDWGPYAARLHRIVKRNWIIPPSAQIGTKGVVRVRFEIGRDGSIHALEILDDSGTMALDDAAWAAIHNSHPLPDPPLPDTWHKDTVGVTWTFYYNTRPR